jgi:hypothetical protein
MTILAGYATGLGAVWSIQLRWLELMMQKIAVVLPALTQELTATKEGMKPWAGPTNRHGRHKSMTTLGRPQLAQQLNPAELDDISIVRREWPQDQESVNGFAGADELFGFSPYVNHGGGSLRTGRTWSVENNT